MTGEVVLLAVGIGAVIAWAVVLCSIGRTIREQPPEGNVTSSPQIRPHDVRPSGAPIEPWEGWE